jgi:chromosome segregation ATPase
MEQLEQSDEARCNLKAELASCTEKVIDLEEQLYASQSSLNDVIVELKRAEDNIESISSEIAKYKHMAETARQQIYYAKKEDKIDQVLG